MSEAGQKMSDSKDEPNPQGSLQLFDESGEYFESLSLENGTRYWFARDVMAVLGYDSWSAFKNVINKAIGVCTTSGIPVIEHFVQVRRTIDSREVDDFQMTRLACCLVAMNGDSKNPAIARAQLYFAALDQVLQELVVIDPANMDRLIIRGEISAREVTLSKTASEAGVESHPRFQNAGYRGMYNMSLVDLKKLKGSPDLNRPLFDFMGRDELAANLFRLSLTEGRIKRGGVYGQAELDYVAHDVGAGVRRMVIQETGVAPETLPLAPDIKVVKKALKNTGKSFSQLDDLESQRVIEAEFMTSLPEAPARDFFPECPECRSGNQNAHSGSVQCTSGSIASGGDVAHCDCEFCRKA
jgi:DNA-damage-inducible protein D